jgi:hypothetical protein
MIHSSQILLMLTDALGLSVQALSRKLGYERPDTFYKIAKDKAYFQYEALLKLLELYPEISADFLLGRSEQVFREAATSSTENEIIREDTQDYTLTIRILEREIREKERRIKELESR